MNSQPLILAVDGGGTKTHALLAVADGDGDWQVVGRGQSGPSNVRAVGAEKALSNLTMAVDAACRTKPTPAVDVAIIALAGAAHNKVRKTVGRWADEHHVARNVQIISDLEIVLPAAFNGDEGIALISGTGSVAYGRRPDGSTVIVGGWGATLGDEGSGYWLGRQALQAATKMSDGRGPETTLLAQLRGIFALSHDRDLVTKVLALPDPHSAIAWLAPLVLAAAEASDVVARRIVEQAVQELANLVQTAVAGLGRETVGFPLAMTGGVLTGNAAFAQAIVAELRHRKLAPDPLCTVTDPIVGAIRVGLRTIA